jgi:hypothetical protein
MRSGPQSEELKIMASSGKKRTTMAKLARESRLRERRLEKQAKKDARKLAPELHPELADGTLNAPPGDSAGSGAGQPDPEVVSRPLTDA